VTPLRRWKLAFLCALALLGLTVVLVPASAHTPEGCDRVRVEVADRLLVLDAATEQGGLTTGQRDQITRERAILAKALTHCAGTPSASPSGAPTTPPASSPPASPSTPPTSSPSTSPSSPPPAAWPDADNTGPPPSLTLTAYTGPCTITTADTVIDAKTVNCDLDIRTTGVQITRSAVNGAITGTPGATYTVADSDVDAAPGTTKRAVTAIGDGGGVATVLRSDVRGGNRGIYCITGCTVRDSYVHGIEVQADWHASALRVGSGATVVHNTLWCDAPDNSTGGGCSADLTGYPDFEPIRDNTIDGNLFKATPGGYCAYGGGSNGKPYSDDPTNATGIKFRDNVFERGTTPGDHGTPTCGYYGAISDFEVGRTGNEWSGNTYDDGTVLNP
jgi:hypothetical protein